MAVISYWELSGNGFGQHAQEDEGSGCLLEEEHFLGATSSTCGTLVAKRTSFSL
jgi:hypothetical protein